MKNLTVVQKVGICGGAVALVAGAVVATVVFIKRRKAKKAQPAMAKAPAKSGK